VTIHDARLLALKALGLVESDYVEHASLVDPVAISIRHAWAEGRISYGQDDRGGPACGAFFRCPLPAEHRGGHAYERMDLVDE